MNRSTTSWPCCRSASRLPVRTNRPRTSGAWLARGLGSRLDAIALVHNVRDTARERLAEIQRCLAATDIAQAGIVENFAAA